MPTIGARSKSSSSIMANAHSTLRLVTALRRRSANLPSASPKSRCNNCSAAKADLVQLDTSDQANLKLTSCKKHCKKHCKNSLSPSPL